MIKAAVTLSLILLSSHRNLAAQDVNNPCPSTILQIDAADAKRAIVGPRWSPALPCLLGFSSGTSRIERSYEVRLLPASVSSGEAYVALCAPFRNQITANITAQFWTEISGGDGTVQDWHAGAPAFPAQCIPLGILRAEGGRWVEVKVVFSPFLGPVPYASRANDGLTVERYVRRGDRWALLPREAVQSKDGATVVTAWDVDRADVRKPIMRLNQQQLVEGVDYSVTFGPGSSAAFTLKRERLGTVKEGDELALTYVAVKE